MEIAKNFVGMVIAIVLAFVILVTAPVWMKIGKGLESSVAVFVAAWDESSAERSGLNDPMIDPEETSFSSEAATYRKATTRRGKAHQNVGACETYRGETFCTSRTYKHECVYDEGISLFWCARD